MRDNQWLAKRLEWLWRTYFADVPVSNEVIVRFGRSARTRLGSIKFGKRKINPRSYITLTGLFRDEQVPDYVVDAVLAHELTHYAHGFHSPHSRLYRHPHAQGVVTKELTARGLGAIVREQKRWLKKNWPKFIRDY